MTNRHKALLEMGERLADEHWDILNQVVATQHATTLYKRGFYAAVDLLLPVVEAAHALYITHELCTNPTKQAIGETLADLDKRLNNKGDRE